MMAAVDFEWRDEFFNDIDPPVLHLPKSVRTERPRKIEAGLVV